jgi:hypothetical protein
MDLKSIVGGPFELGEFMLAWLLPVPLSLYDYTFPFPFYTLADPPPPIIELFLDPSIDVAFA